MTLVPIYDGRHYSILEFMLTWMMFFYSLILYALLPVLVFTSNR